MFSFFCFQTVFLPISEIILTEVNPKLKIRFTDHSPFAVGFILTLVEYLQIISFFNDWHIHSELSPHIYNELSPHINSKLSPHIHSKLSPHIHSKLSPHINSKLSPYIHIFPSTLLKPEDLPLDKIFNSFTPSFLSKSLHMSPTC